MLSGNVKQVSENCVKSPKATITTRAALPSTELTSADPQNGSLVSSFSSYAAFDSCELRQIETDLNTLALSEIPSLDAASQNVPLPQEPAYAPEIAEPPSNPQSASTPPEVLTESETLSDASPPARSSSPPVQLGRRKKQVLRIRRHIARDLPAKGAVPHDEQKPEQTGSDRIRMRQIRTESKSRADNETAERYLAAEHASPEPVTQSAATSEESIGEDNEEASQDTVPIQYHAVKHSRLVRYPTGSAPRMWAPDESLLEHLRQLAERADSEEAEPINHEAQTRPDSADQTPIDLRAQKRKLLYQWYASRMRGRAAGGGYPLRTPSMQTPESFFPRDNTDLKAQKAEFVAWYDKMEAARKNSPQHTPKPQGPTSHVKYDTKPFVYEDPAQDGLESSQTQLSPTSGASNKRRRKQNRNDASSAEIEDFLTSRMVTSVSSTSLPLAGVNKQSSQITVSSQPAADPEDSSSPLDSLSPSSPRSYHRSASSDTTAADSSEPDFELDFISDSDLDLDSDLVLEYDEAFEAMIRESVRRAKGQKH